jgi:prepilin-type N-terminal cleavage/methylation domain-containing protein
MTNERNVHGTQGFTLIELILVVGVLVLIGWAVMHFLARGEDEPKTPSAVQEEELSSRGESTDEEAEEVPAESLDESSSKTVLKVILVGLLWLGGITWQVFLIVRDQDDGPGLRVLPAAIAGGVLFVGVVVVSGFEVFDERRGLPIASALGNVGRAAVLSVSLMVKSYLGPLTVALALSSVVYFLLTYGELRTIPLIQGVFDWVFTGAPRWLSWAYAAIVALYSLGGAIHDTDIDL